MVTKKTNSTAKKQTTKKTPAKTTKKSSVTAKKVSKPKAVKAPKASKKVEPFHPIFGIVLLIVCCITAAFLVAFITCKLMEHETDAEKFASEYTLVDKDNIFVYKNAEEIVDILEDGTGVVFLGYPSCAWCQTYAAMINDLAKEYGISKIYYHNIYNDRDENTENYTKIVEILNDHLQFDNVGNKYLYVPDTAFVVDGEIIGNDWETSKDTLNLETPEEYWTEERVTAWKEKLSSLFEQVKSAQK